MRKKYKLNVFGDSFSTSNLCVDPQDSFWGQMSQLLSVNQVDNYSHPGFSLDHVIHIILNENFDFENEYFFVGIPPLVRFVAYGDKSNTNWNKQSYLGFGNNPEISVIESLTNTVKFQFKEQFTNDKDGADRFNAEWHDVQCLEKIYLLHQFLKSKNAKFIIANLTVPIHYQDLWPAGKNIMTKVWQLPECIIFDHTYYSVNYKDGIKPVDFSKYQWLGHHGAEGNKNWFVKVLEPKIKQLGWLNA